MKKIIIILVVVGVVAFLWWSFKPEISIEPADSQSEASAPFISGDVVVVTDARVIVYENNAFSPAELKIKVGDRVIFTNKHVAPIRIASNPHPVHTSFREFDSDTLASGETYEFTFKTSMTLNYHNHFNPGVGGKIVVE